MMCIDSVDFVRIQVNGAEIETLQRMETIMLNTNTLLVSALYKRNGIYAYKIVAERLSKKGFKTEIYKGKVLASKQ